MALIWTESQAEEGENDKGSVGREHGYTACRFARPWHLIAMVPFPRWQVH